MENETPPTTPEPAKGLPAVHPPSGRHVVQLFLIPGLIVAGAVTILLGFSWLAGGNRTPEQFLKNIDSSNPDIRWRAANDLAQVLKRDDKLAADVSFALRLAERLQRAVDELERTENTMITATDDKTRADAKKSLESQRTYVQYLGASLGNFIVPVGAPLLNDLARKGRGKDETLRYLIRRQAVWGLANLGESRKRFAKLGDEEKSEIRSQLEAEAKTAASDETRAWANAALASLDGKSIGVIATLAECARDPRDIFLREQVAHALSFWEGTPDEQLVAEQTLLLLIRDAGVGHDKKIVLEK